MGLYELINGLSMEDVEAFMEFLREFMLYAKLRTLAYYIYALNNSNSSETIEFLKKTMEDHVYNILCELAKIEHHELMVDVDPEVLGKYLVKRAVAKVNK